MIIWITFGLAIGIFGYLLDTDRSFENLFRNTLLGLVGALQGMVLSTILLTVPLFEAPLSPMFFSFVGGLLLLSIGKIAKKAF